MRVALPVALAFLVACGGNQPAPATSDTTSPTASPTQQPADQIESTTAPPLAPAPRASCSDYGEELPGVLAATSPPAWLPGGDSKGSCDMDEAGHLVENEYTAVSKEVGKYDGSQFDVTHSGPSGSGRYWSVGLSFVADATVRGLCFYTSTVGWRHVGSNQTLATALIPLIAWIQDPDGDGDQEFVVRGSFDVGGGGLGDHAITATAYDLEGGHMVLDRKSTHILRTKIADAYAYQGAQLGGGTTEEDRAHYRGAVAHLRKHSCKPTAE